MDSDSPTSAGTARETTCDTHSVAKTFMVGNTFKLFNSEFSRTSAPVRGYRRVRHHPLATGDGLV
jgi:hypothetical protein